MDREDELYTAFSKRELAKMLDEEEQLVSDLESKIQELEQEVEVFERRSEDKTDIINDLEERLDRCCCSDSDEADPVYSIQFGDPLETPILEIDINCCSDVPDR